MYQVWKYILDKESGPQTFKIPGGGLFLHAAIQKNHGENQVCLWIKVNPKGPKFERKFEIFGTGWDLPVDAAYLGSVQEIIPPSPLALLETYLVWHIFERF